VTKVTICPPGAAEGSGDLREWATRRRGGASGVRNRQKIDDRSQRDSTARWLGWKRQEWLAEATKWLAERGDPHPELTALRIAEQRRRDGVSSVGWK
jgi:hypothetical protein